MGVSGDVYVIMFKERSERGARMGGGGGVGEVTGRRGSTAGIGDTGYTLRELEGGQVAGGRSTETCRMSLGASSRCGTNYAGPGGLALP